MADAKRRQRVVVSVAQYLPGLDDRREFEKSITDPSGSETISEMVVKFLSGERKARFNPEYEVKDDDDPLLAIEQMNPTRREGFDLADGARIAKEARARIRDIVDEKRKKKEAPAKGAGEVKAGAGSPAPESKPAEAGAEENK